MITFFTGNPGSGIALAACGAALASAARGQTTLLVSLGPSHSLAALLGQPVGSRPTPVAAQLEALALDTPGDLAALWDATRSKLSGPLGQVNGDELPLLPGSDLLFGMLRLRELAPHYQAIMVDAGPHDNLLRAMATPDALRWLVRLLFGLDRGPGRNPASLARAVLPVSFLAPEMVGQVQDARAATEAIRAALFDPAQSAACYVLRPDAAALDEARLALPAIQLYGLRVAQIASGSLLPLNSGVAAIQAQAEAQATIVAEARALWLSRPLAAFAQPGATLADLRVIGEQLPATPPGPAPLAEQYDGKPALTIDLPGLPMSALKLTQSGDEMIIRVGPYRRHILLPEALRGNNPIRAGRAGDILLIRPR